MLKNDELGFEAAFALGAIGPDAREAIPSLTELLQSKYSENKSKNSLRFLSH
jgi:hypothetical protein